MLTPFLSSYVTIHSLTYIQMAVSQAVNKSDHSQIRPGLALTNEVLSVLCLCISYKKVTAWCRVPSEPVLVLSAAYLINNFC
jgi:hypothetical protein